MSFTAVNKVLELIRTSDLTVEDLHKINQFVINQSKNLGRQNIHQFNIGDNVQFTNPKNGKTFVGRLIKINSTKAQVKVDFTVWNVPFSVLKSA